MHMLKNSKSQNNIVWAIDPLTKSQKNLARAKKIIQAWQPQKSLQVKPVSLVTPDDLRLPVAFMAPWGAKLQELTEKAIKPFLSSLRLKNMAEPAVIMCTAKDAIEEFLSFAKNQKAQMILTMTHDRDSFDKNRIGKFTQKLIEKSSIPVLTVRPTTNVPEKIKKILYPTDFSKASKGSYIKAVKIAKSLQSNIVIFHNIYEPVLPAAEFTGVIINNVEILKTYTEEYSRSQNLEAEKWIEIAKREGVKAEFRAARADFSLCKSILSAALKERVHLIILGIESHPFMRAVLKSSTREVISFSNRPVLIINNREQAEKSQKKNQASWKDPNSILI